MGLQANSLGLTESVVMGVAGTAPAYSIEITTSTIIATAGVLSPASVLVCGLIMFGIAFAFIQMNRALPSAGTSYAWVAMAFGPTLGFFAGWAAAATGQGVFTLFPGIALPGAGAGCKAPVRSKACALQARATPQTAPAPGNPKGRHAKTCHSALHSLHVPTHMRRRAP